tara:strand:+ start:12586 stop:13722 length:1137 start_codon:yes stop_codon:yes gene_type:complete
VKCGRWPSTHNPSRNKKPVDKITKEMPPSFLDFEFVQTLPRPRALDLFCGGGGAGFGLHQAGFKSVVGVDTKDLKRVYEQTKGMHFVRGDVTKIPVKYLKLFDFTWASPPCQFATGIIPEKQREQHEQKWRERGGHVNLIPSTRKLLKAGGRPYIIENVMGAKQHMKPTVKLCGTMFPQDDLRVFRQRLFESNVALSSPTPTCQRNGATLGGRAPKTMVSQPKTEKLLGGSDGSLPAGFEAKPVEFPCRKGMHVDYIYVPTTEQNSTAVKEMYGRKYCRSVREALRALGQLVPMSEAEIEGEKMRYEKEMAGKRPKSATAESDFFPIYGTDIRRGTTMQWRSALGIPWMDRDQLREAIPPAYSRHLGKQVIATIQASS